MIDRIAFEKNLFQIEQKLNNWAVIPFLGSVPALAKACLGALQLITALVVAVLTALPALFNSKARDLFFYTWVHLKHGTANLISGLTMAIPFGGLVVYCVTAGGIDLHVDVGQDFHFMLYPNHAFKEGRLTYDYRHQGCGVLAWTFDDDDDFSPLFEGMSTEEAMSIGLLKPNLQVDENALLHIRQEYEADRIMLRGMLKSQRLKQIEKEHQERMEHATPLKIGAGLGTRKPMGVT